MHTSLKAAAGTLFLAVLLLVAGGVAGASTAQFPPATTVPGFPTPTTLAPGAVPTTGVLVPDTTPTTAASTATTGPGTVTSLEEPVESDADTLDKILAETATTTITERGATRMDDQTSEASMEQRKKEGYF